MAVRPGKYEPWTKSQRRKICEYIEGLIDTFGQDYVLHETLTDPLPDTRSADYYIGSSVGP